MYFSVSVGDSTWSSGQHFDLLEDRLIGSDRDGSPSYKRIMKLCVVLFTVGFSRMEKFEQSLYM